MFAYCKNNPVNCLDPSGATCIFEHNYEGGCVGYTDAGTGGRGSYTNSAGTTVTFSPSSVEIDAYLTVDGDIDSSVIIQGIKDYWEGDYSVDWNKKSVTVTIHLGASPNGDTIFVHTYNSGGVSKTGSIYRGASCTVVKLYSLWEDGRSKDVRWSIAHEFGHCLGIEDYYKHVEAKEIGYYPSFNSIMNSRGMHASDDDIAMLLAAAITGQWQEWRPK